MFMDLCRKECLPIFINRALGQSVEDRDLDRSGVELPAYRNTEADSAEKCDADCFTGVN
jgi:hypothetical protein